MRRLTPLAILMALAGPSARVNDSSAAMAVGGLELVKNDQVRMVSEILRIAPRLVQVDDVFENTSGTDVTTEVALPLGLGIAAAVKLMTLHQLADLADQRASIDTVQPTASAICTKRPRLNASTC